ncbi:MAG: Uncharacterised protein [Flavobacteriaceae bacterium]|jgi:hypothetical protein|nr:MAG: Uncharacterised protein [Flavobacteriaceae bacterium]
MLLTKVAKMERVTTHCGVFPDPKIKDFEVRFLEKNMTLK